MALEALQDRYAHIAPLGAGGFGEVYRAEQISTGQLVAIKRLKVDVRASQADVGRFARELRIVANLGHPNIVRLLDTGVIDEGDGHERYLVFEFVQGQTLADHLAAHGPLPLDEATRLMAQVLDALACAHAAGVVHRDVKPQNIMLAAGGLRPNAQLLDFGIAAVCEAQRDASYDVLTRDGEAPGTLCYSAPEQLRGQAAHPQIDLFAWGLVFVECLTGERVLQGRLQSDVLRQLLGPEPIALPAVAEPVAVVLAQALHKDPAQRFASAHDAYAALQACARQVPPPTASPAPVVPPVTPDPPDPLEETAAPVMVSVSADSAPKASIDGPARWPWLVGAGLVLAGGLVWLMRDAEAPEPTPNATSSAPAVPASQAPATQAPASQAPATLAKAPPSKPPPMQIHQAAIRAAVDRAAYRDAVDLARAARADTRVDRAALDEWLRTAPALAPLRAHSAWRSLFPPTRRKPRRPAAIAPKTAAPATAAPAIAAPATTAPASDWKRFH